MRTWGLILALALAPACRKAVVSTRINPGVVDPGSKIHGKTYGEWSAEWFKFVYTIPSSENPFLHDDKCEARQSGPVWFLTGKRGESPVVATRHCTIPFGKYLFVPVASVSGDNVGFSPPKSIDELRAGCKQATDSHLSIKCWLDGRELQGISSAMDSPYRAVSPVFNYKTVAGDLRGLPAGMSIDPVVADGVYLMLEPLAAGSHTIRVAGSSAASSYSYVMTYLIDVAAPGR